MFWHRISSKIPPVIGVKVKVSSGTSRKKQSSSSEPKKYQVLVREFKLGFGRFSGSSDGFTASEARDVLLFLFSGLENLCEDLKLATRL